MLRPRRRKNRWPRCLQKANPKKGAEIFKRCEACHDGTKGGPNKVGPNLWNVIGRPIATHPGFSYSNAIKQFSDGGKKHWTYELINKFITGPRDFIPGTAMTFAGLPKAQERADVLSYLRTLNDNPPPLPQPEAAAGDKAAGDKAASGGAASGGAASGGAASGGAASGGTFVRRCRDRRPDDRAGGARTVRQLVFFGWRVFVGRHDEPARGCAEQVAARAV